MNKVMRYVKLFIPAILAAGFIAAPALAVKLLPTVAKSFSPNTIAANGTSTLTITLTNSNSTPMTGTAFTDTYPANIMNTASPGLTYSCTHGTATAAASGTSLALTGGDIPGNSSCTLTVQVTATAAGSYTNSTGTVTTSNDGNGSAASATLTVTAISAANSTVAASPTSVPADGTTASTITVTLKDGAGNPVSGKTVTLTAGSGSSVISAASGPSNASGVVTFTVTDTVAEPVTYTAMDTTDSITIIQTATVTFSAALMSSVSSFNAFESTTAAGAITGVIYTKIAGSAFGLDVVAIGLGAQATGFTGAVKVELLGNTATGIALDAQNCPISFTLLQTVSPTPTIAGGRSSVSFAAVADAWKDVRVRISYPAILPTIISCSTDNFAIRPNSLVVSATDADWVTAGTARALNNSGATGGNVHKAGQPFTLSTTAYNAAAAITNNYAGSPAVQTIACTLPTPTCTNGSVTVPSGTWSVSSPGTIANSSASYSEAGSFNLILQDTTFASVDSADGTPATCAGYYVCSAAVPVGRFVPNHFVVTASGTPQFKTFNNTVCAARSFTYIGQPFGYVTAPQVLVSAQNAGNAITANYSNNLWKLIAAAGTQDCTTNPDICTLTSGSVTQTYTYATTPAATPNWDSAQVVLGTPGITANNNGTGTVTSSAADLLAFKRSLTVPQILFTASIALADSVVDASEAGNCGVANCNITTLAPATFSNIAFDAGNEFRYGRLSLSNAYGSESLDLPVPIQVQYWNGYAFVTNTADNCTNLGVANITLGNYQGGITGVNMGVANISYFNPFAAGAGRLTLTKPSPTPTSSGSVDVTVSLGVANENKPYLQGNWTGANYDQNPVSRAAFGVYKNANEFIYQRENY